MTVPSFSAGYDAVMAPAITVLLGVMATERVDWTADQEFTEPDSGVWARTRVRFAGGGHAAIGATLFASKGIASVQVFGEVGSLSTIEGYASSVLNAYRRANVTGVRFTNMHIDGDGTGEGTWVQRTVVSNFEFDEQL